MNITEKIALLHGLRMSPQGKAMLVLVLLEHRPAAEIDLYARHGSFGDISKILSVLGLFCCIRNRRSRDAEYCMTMYVARDFLIAKKAYDLAACVDKKPRKKTHVYFAQLLGYPDTAINAFTDRVKKTKRLMLSQRRYPKSMLTNPFREFSFSSAHFEEEMKLVLQWQAVVHDVAPAIYFELTGVSVAA